MKLVNRLGKRVFYSAIDAYFVFKTRLDDHACADRTDYPGEYSVRVVCSQNDVAFPWLCDLWQEAYCQGIDARQYDIEGIVSGLFMDGDVCCCLFCRDSLVGMDWLGFSRSIKRMDFTAYLKGELQVSVGHHIYIKPLHRGGGLQKATDVLRKNVARERGAVSQYLFVGVKNFASVRNMMKCNQYYKLLYHIKVDVPFLTVNYFPGRHVEPWIPCRSRGQTRSAGE